MKKIRLFVASLAVAVFGVAYLAPATATYAYNPLDDVCSQAGAGDNAVCKKKDEDGTKVVGIIVNTLMFLTGIASVAMIIWGGFRYVTSAGNAASVATAKNTIIYAVIGLVVAIVSYAIVHWVLHLFE